MWWQRDNKNEVQADTIPKQVEKPQHPLPFHWYTAPLPFSWYRLKPIQYTSEHMSLEEDTIKRALQIPSCEWHEAKWSYYFGRRYNNVYDRFAQHRTPSGKLLEVALTHEAGEENCYDQSYDRLSYMMTVDSHTICCTKTTWYESSGRRDQYSGYSGVLELYGHAFSEINKIKSAQFIQQQEAERLEKQRQSEEQEKRRKKALENW